MLQATVPPSQNLQIIIKEIFSDNKKYVFEPISNDYIIECLKRLVQIGLVEPLDITEEVYIKPFNISEFSIQNDT